MRGFDELSPQEYSKESVSTYNIYEAEMSDRHTKGSSLVPYYRSPQLPVSLREEIPWERCFPWVARYVRPLSRHDILYHEAPTGGYGIFNSAGDLLACKGSPESAFEWVLLEEDHYPLWMH